MKTLFLLLLFCHVSSPVKHSLNFFFSGSSGILNFPECLGVTLVDDIQAGYCDSNNKTEVKQDAAKKLFADNPELMELYTQYCFVIQPVYFKAMFLLFMVLFQQIRGVHMLQLISGCEWDENTGEVTGVFKHGYDGEDFISLDMKSLTWIALKPEAVIIKEKWDADKDLQKSLKDLYTQACPRWLNMYLKYENSSLSRTDLPSMSLLQKTPSSPISCHATGFYPDRSMMFWRKDGEEIHEDVDHGEILLNHDGTFQMSVDLNISSVRPEDWRRYDCVFQLSGVDNNTIIRLDKTVIRTNWGRTGNDVEFPAAAVIGVVVGLLLLAGCITGLFMWRKKKNGSQ